MRLDHLIATAADHLVGRLVRRALIALVMVACAIVALYQFTNAGNIALSGHYGDLNARLIIGGIYAALALISLVILWAMRSNGTKPSATPVRSNTREMQLVMLVEAVMLGYTLARKRERTG